MPFVLDASVALAWHFEDEAGTADGVSERAIDDLVVVPGHWFVEVANGLLVGERRKRTRLDRIAAFVARLDMLAVEVDDMPHDQLFSRILPLSRAHGLTAYDALYLELAERRGLPLATLDEKLREAASIAGVLVVGDPA